jgi:hypothetical protein
MRVYFHDKTATSYYAKDAADEASLSMTRNVADDLMAPLNTLWQNTSYGKISISSDITSLYQISGESSAYITNHSNGDLSEGAQFGNVIKAAVASIPSGYNFNDYAGILVLMADSDTVNKRFHRGQATQCNTNSTALPVVDNNHSFGCVVMSENPGIFAQKPMDEWDMSLVMPSNSLRPTQVTIIIHTNVTRDSNYPGHTGAFRQQSNQGFPGRMPPSQYIEVSQNHNVDRICLRIIERITEHFSRPTGQSKIPVTKYSISILISAHDQVLVR